MTMGNKIELTAEEVEAILKYAECDMNESRACAALGLQGIRYRFESIREKTGMNPRRFYDLCELVVIVKKGEFDKIKRNEFAKERVKKCYKIIDKKDGRTLYVGDVEELSSVTGLAENTIYRMQSATKVYGKQSPYRYLVKER